MRVCVCMCVFSAHSLRERTLNECLYGIVILPFEFKHYPYNLCAQEISTTQNFPPRTFPIYDTLACIHSCSAPRLKFRVSCSPYIFTVRASQQIFTYSEILTKN
ncbi:hypothetical protein ACRRTK_001135 [Alexandromys fortis]